MFALGPDSSFASLVEIRETGCQKDVASQSPAFGKEPGNGSPSVRETALQSQGEK